MNFKEHLASDMDVFLNTDECAETVVYNGVGIRGVFDPGLGPSRATEAVEDLARLWVSRQDVENPSYRDVVVIGADSWRVSYVITGDDVAWELAITLDSRPKP